MNRVGHWSALMVGPAAGWDRTILGFAVYDADGDLVWFRAEPIEKAIRRGDWSERWSWRELKPPPTWREMELLLTSTSNAMSTVRWEGGHPTLNWDAELWQEMYDQDVRRCQASSPATQTTAT